jgi:hypothetical protein
MTSIKVRVMGGLGNQLFSYAFGKALASNQNKKLFFDCSSGFISDPFQREYLIRFFPNAKVDILHKKSSKVYIYIFKSILLVLKYISELLPLSFKFVINEGSPWKFNNRFLNEKYFFSPYFIGYWASHLYFSKIQNELRYELIPPKPNKPEVLKLLSKIKQVNSCFVHWRSYEDCPSSKKNLFYYYKNSFDQINSYCKNVVFFVFSDSPNLAKNFFKNIDSNCIYVNFESLSGNVASLNDFYLMYSCKHAIIGDSSFSWWAAWLSDIKTKKILYPENISPWGKDWAPESWISIPNKAKRKKDLFK